MTRWSPVLLFFLIVVGGILGISLVMGDVADDITLGLDLQGGFEILYQVVPIEDDQVVDRELLENTYAALQRRVDALGVNEPELMIESPDRIRVRLAGVDDQETARSILSTQARLTFRDTNDNVMMGGEHLREGSARVVHDEVNRPVVNIEFSDSQRAGEVTTQLLQQPMVIWLDFEEGVDSYEDSRSKEMSGEDPAYISAPIVRDTLRTSGSISSPTWTYQEASELASLLNAGALPVDLTELTARGVGASLGAQAMEYTVTAAYIGGILVLLYMIAYYRLPGVVAGISLLFYVFLIILVFNWLDAVLTLPGIAALVLGVGMAVDANIITNERIKEEIRSGKTINSSFRAGAKRSLRTILDANITTIIAATVLFYFGDFAIQGFALMLIITILLSFVTAVLGSRLLLGLLVASRSLDRKPQWFGVKESDISEL